MCLPVEARKSTDGDSRLSGSRVNRVFKLSHSPTRVRERLAKGVGEFVPFQSGASGRRPRLKRKAKGGGEREGVSNLPPLPLLLPTHNPRDKEEIRNSRIEAFCKGAQSVGSR